MVPDLSSPSGSFEKPVIPVFSRWLGSWNLSLSRRPYAVDELAWQYDRNAHGWHNRITQLGFSTAYRDLCSTVLRQKRYAPQSRSLRVLDVGVGSGALSRALCEALARPVQLDGIDISPAMLVEAEAQLRGVNADTRLQLASAEQLPFADSSFDVVLAAHVIEHLADPDIAIAEIYRVVKPGGIVVVCITRHSPAGAYIQLLWRTHRVGWRRAIAWLRRAGFQSVRAVPFVRRSAARRLSIGYVGRKPVLDAAHQLK